MKKLLLCLLLFPLSRLCAQDTLWVQEHEGKPVIRHQVKAGETLFMLSRRYAVPPAALADLNGVNYQDGLAAGRLFLIPVGNYNFLRIEHVAKSRPLFYLPGDTDDLRSIGRMFTLPQSAIQRWNSLDNPELEAGRALQVGWIAYDDSQVPFPATNSASATLPVPRPDTAAGKKPPARKAAADTALAAADTDTTQVHVYEALYEQQTLGTAVNEESGAATFYRLKMKAAEGVYYAMHNTALRGTIIKVSNPANGKMVYVKVIGTIPNLKEYHNSVIAISSNAASALGAADRRMFARLQYR